MKIRRRSQEQVLRKKLRKPSVSRIEASTSRQWWKFGFSEAALTKVKLLFGVLVTIVALASALLTLLKIYASDEETFKRYADRAIAWHYKTDLWNGYFSNQFEGIVNIAELNLSDSTMALALQVSGNTIDGGMAEKRLCGIFPPQDFKLVRGTISHFGNSAEIQIFEYVQGHTKMYAEFDLQHDGLVIEVTPKRNSRWFGRDVIRLIHHPESTIDSGFTEMKGVCKEEQAEFRKMLKKNFDQLVKEGELKPRISPVTPSGDAAEPRH